MLGAHNMENANQLEQPSPIESHRFQSHLQLQLQNQISHPVPEQPYNNISKFQNVFTERDFDFVSKIFSNILILRIYIIDLRDMFLIIDVTGENDLSLFIL